jgi:hypothetical protein
MSLSRSIRFVVLAAAVAGVASVGVASSQQAPPQAGSSAGGATPGAPQTGTPARGGGPGRGAQPFDMSDNEGWVSLFDGQTLNGWDGDTRYWGVKDGSIYVEPSCEKPTGTIYIVWQGGEASDFMLKFESKGTANVNGGIQYRSYLTADNNVTLKYPGRGGGGFVARGGGAGGGRAGAGPGSARGATAVGGGGQIAPAGAPAGAPVTPVGAAGRGGGGGRGPACANPGNPPTAAEKAKWDMAGPQFDFDAGNRYPGQYYEQSGRGIVASPGQAVMAEQGKPSRVLAMLADRATLDSWFKKDDYNQFLLIAKGNTHSMYMNGHLISLFIDNDPTYFRPSGKIGIEVEGAGAYYTKSIWMKRL